jgi:hypothetical protein
MGRAEELFGRIRAGGAAEVHRMIAAPVVEELFLDYKRASTTLPSAKLSEDDRKNLGKAIAGFANSEGGVIVWGVDCRHTVHGDVPTGPAPITQPVALKTLIDGALGGLTLPAHSGVENLALEDTPRTEGFVITHIPIGLHVPYQALYPRQEYYIRAGSSFLPTPHAVLAGLFGRAPQPNVAPVIRFNVAEGSKPTVIFNLGVSVTNDGRGIAEEIFCVAEAKRPSGSKVAFPYDKDHYRGWRTLSDGRDCFTLLLSQAVLPPGTEQYAFGIQIECTRGQGDVVFTVSCGSRGGPGAAQTIVIPGPIVDAAIEHYGHQYPNAVLKKNGDELQEFRIRAYLRRV